MAAAVSADASDAVDILDVGPLGGDLTTLLA